MKIIIVLYVFIFVFSFSPYSYAGSETDYMDLEEGATITTPDSGLGRLQMKTDKILYMKDDAGVEHNLMSNVTDLDIILTYNYAVVVFNGNVVGFGG